MRIAYFWTWEFSRNICKSILEYKDIEIVARVSQIDKNIWKNKIPSPTKLKELCIKQNIPVLQPDKLKDNTDFFDNLKKLDLDFIVVVAYWKIIPKEILEIPKFGCINIHWSILPIYRWASPVQECLKNWDTKTWLTIMYMSEKMDEWDILQIKDFKINQDDKNIDIFAKFEQIWPDLLVDTLTKIVSKEIIPKSQNHEWATYCNKIEKKDWEIDLKKDNIDNIYNKYRAYYKWPWIYTYYKGKKFDLTDIEVDKNDLCYFDDDFSLWDVVELEDHWENHIAIMCNWGLLILNKVKLEWKKEMSIFDFVNGNKDFLDYNFNF